MGNADKKSQHSPLSCPRAPHATICSGRPGHPIQGIACRSRGISFPMRARRCAWTSSNRLPNRSVGGTCFAPTASSAMRIRPHASLETWPMWSAGGRRSWTRCQQPSARPGSRRTTPRCLGSRGSISSNKLRCKRPPEMSAKVIFRLLLPARIRLNGPYAR
jgi:hypothetical protein